MLSCLQDARLAFSRPLRRAVLAHARAASSTSSAVAQPANDIAQRLHDSGVWTDRRTKGRKFPNSDRYRVNIVDDGLCDDILRYIGPSLERHRGCDLLDINPGAGVWSRKLHEALQPRKHVLMENDADLYAPFLSDLVARDNVELIAKSGIVWDELNQALRSSFPNQKTPARGAKPKRNDTLLVSLNIALHPKKAYRSFDCVSDLVLYQFMSAIRSGALFQKYGLVRMLIWVNDERKRKLLPRSISRRRRVAFEAELSCEWVHEVAGKDMETEKRTELRDEWINKESGYNTLARMRRMKLTMPKGRETNTYLALKGAPNPGALAGIQVPDIARPFRQELEELEEAAGGGVETPRLKALRYREKYSAEAGALYLSLLKELDAAHKLPWPRAYVKLAAANTAFNAALANLKKNTRNEFAILRDNYHLFRQKTPVMFWDQRRYEPLRVRPDDFFPNVEAALLDLQPRAMHPLLRDGGHHDNNPLSANMAQMMLRYWFAHSMFPVSKAMDGLWPGFSASLSECPSLRNPHRGGSPLTGLAELNARCVNREQWEEIVAAMMSSPFRPTYSQMVSRLLDDVETALEDDELKPGAMGSITSSGF